MLSRLDYSHLLAGTAALVAATAIYSLATRPGEASRAPSDPTRAARMYFEQTGTLPATFHARGADYAISLTPDGARLDVSNGDAHAHLELSFSAASPSVTLLPAGAAAPVAHYYVGNDPMAWRRNVALHERIVFRDLYTNVDAVFYGNGRSFEFDFVVAPHADPHQVRLRFSGQDTLSLDRAGDLILHTRAGPVRQRRPVAYQTIDGERRHVSSFYVLTTNGDVRIELGDYDRTQPLVIDPTLDFSTYFGGSKPDHAARVAVDASGNAYVVGYTFSSDINPSVVHGETATSGDLTNVFLAKYDADGGLDYVAYLGGSKEDYGRGVAVNENGVAFITGETQSADFPRTGTTPRPFGGGWDAFVTVLAADGSKLIYSGLLGGSGPDFGHGIALRSNGDVYVAGETWSPDFPLTASTALATKCGGCGPDTYDGFLTVLDVAKDAPLYSTYFGGNGNDKIHSVAVNAGTGVAYIAGETSSDDLPVLNAAQSERAGASDIVFAAIDPGKSGSASLLYSSYLGGSADDTAEQVAVNMSGHVYVAGVTESTDFPDRNAYQTALRGARDALVAKFNPAASGGLSLLFATYYGGSGDEAAESVAVNALDGPVISGMTSSADLPTVLPVQRALSGPMDGFLATLSVGGNSLQYATFVGGAGHDELAAVAIAPDGILVAAGESDSDDLPIAGGAPQHTRAGGTDAILVKVDSSVGATTGSGSASSSNSKDTKAAGGGSLDALALLAIAFATRRRYRARA
jgi:hypothetical protein